MYNPYYYLYLYSYSGGVYQPSAQSKGPTDIRYFHPGDSAPDFILEGVESLHLKSFRLKDYLGKWVLLFFYGSNFTYV